MIPLRDIEAARDRIAGAGVVRTPLVRLHEPEAPAEIWLKLENLQPINSFKLRGALNAILGASADARAEGLVTASAGNMAQGVAWAARSFGLPATIAVPEHAPQAKLDAITRLGGKVIKVPYDDWWRAIVTSRVDGIAGLFVHPVQDPAVMAGNGTIGLEILEDLPDVDTIVIPYGGGGLTTGIASAVKALAPGTRIVTAEPATAAAFVAARAAGEPVDVEYQPSFVDGSGSRRVLDSMWPLVSLLADDAIAVPVYDVAAAVRLLAERVRVIAEGAGALALAAALSGAAGTGKVVCVVSGGNINLATLAGILSPELGRRGTIPARAESGHNTRACLAAGRGSVPAAGRPARRFADFGKPAATKCHGCRHAVRPAEFPPRDRPRAATLGLRCKRALEAPSIT